MERKGKETAEAGGTCCELQRRRMALNVRSPTGGECGSASSGEAQNQAHFLGGDNRDFTLGPNGKSNTWFRQESLCCV